MIPLQKVETIDKIPGVGEAAIKQKVLEYRRCVILAIVGATPTETPSLVRILSNGYLTSVKSWLDDALSTPEGRSGLRCLYRLLVIKSAYLSFVYFVLYYRWCRSATSPLIEYRKPTCDKVYREGFRYGKGDRLCRKTSPLQGNSKRIRDQRPSSANQGCVARVRKG